MDKFKPFNYKKEKNVPKIYFNDKEFKILN